MEAPERKKQQQLKDSKEQKARCVEFPAVIEISESRLKKKKKKKRPTRFEVAAHCVPFGRSRDDQLPPEVPAPANKQTNKQTCLYPKPATAEQRIKLISVPLVLKKLQKRKTDSVADAGVKKPEGRRRFGQVTSGHAGVRRRF